MPLFKRFSLFLVIASIIGATTFIYLRSDFSASRTRSQDVVATDSKSEQDHRADSALTAAATAGITKSEDSHGANCAHCSGSGGNFTRIDAQLFTDPAHDRVFKKLARMEHKVISPATFDFLRGSKQGEAVSFQIGEIAFRGEISLVRENHPKARTYGIKLDGDSGRVLVKTDAAESMSLNIFFMNDRRIITAREFNLEGSGSGLVLQESTIGEILCVHPDTILTAAGFHSASEMSALNAQAPTSNLPIPSEGLIASAFESNSESEYVMYLDFDGETVRDSTWNEFYGYSIHAIPQPRAGEEEWVRLVWRRVVEDFAPFDLNVTTDRNVFDAADPDKRLQVIITSSTQVTRSGVAFLYSFREDSPIVWVNHSEEYWCATTISHQAGHAFGLVHDSMAGAMLGDDYYLGHNESYAPGWGPIMGAPFGDLFEDEVDQWSIGEYPNAENLFDRQLGLKTPELPFEDDVSIIGDDVDPQEGVTPRFQGQSTEASNGFGFVTDDYANSFDRGGVGAFEITGNNVIEASGLISTRGDVDVFEFEAPAGTLRFIIAPLDVNSVYLESGSNTAGANLAVDARLLDVSGEVIAVGRDAGGNQLTSLIETSVLEGSYYLEVDGGGRGTEPATGFSDYGSLGEYNVLGELNLPQVVDDTDLDDLLDSFEQQIIDANLGDAIDGLDDVLPGDDFDGDGLTNLEEQTGGTDPTDALSPRFQIIEGDFTWHEAVADARARGGRLAVLDTQEKIDTSLSLVLDNQGAIDETQLWIGLTDELVEGEFRWINGNPLSVENWVNGQPDNSGGNEDYVHMDVAHGEWNDHMANIDYFGYFFEVYEPLVSINPVSKVAVSAGGSYEIAVTSNTYWSVTESLGWVNVSSTSGIGNGTITVTVDENLVTSPRSGTISIDGETHDLTQEGAASVATTWFSGASQIQPAGWLYFSWFKAFRPVGGNWIYHAKHGWMYSADEDTSSIFFYDLGLNRWIWTNDTVYPFMYAFGPEGGWVFFFEDGSPGERFFARATSGEIVSEAEFGLNP